MLYHRHLCIFSIFIIFWGVGELIALPLVRLFASGMRNKDVN